MVTRASKRGRKPYDARQLAWWVQALPFLPTPVLTQLIKGLEREVDSYAVGSIARMAQLAIVMLDLAVVELHKRTDRNETW